jgi:hypothetical protein
VTLTHTGRNGGTALPYPKATTTRLAASATGDIRYCSEVFVYL